MRSTLVLLTAAFGAPLLAQANAIPGLDVHAYDVTDIASFGRRGPAHPNGEVGFGIGHSYCNAGTVPIAWVATSGGVMIDTYPRIAYLLARESGDRVVQVSGRSYMKHSRTPFNFGSGPCAPCQAGPTGTMRVGCSDTYGSGTNVNRFNLGPTAEVDPWLGTWNAIGSYFDRGDPAVAGAAAADGVQSLTSTMIGAFDPIKNMVEVKESELVVGGRFYGQAQLAVVGEPGANRGNNAVSRAFAITWNGSSWVASSLGSSVPGSVLNQWTGATVDVGGNGTDDGHFAVGVKVTGPFAGLWHYEYAVHNLDNSRGAASLRIPVDPSATVTNAGFRDIDTDALNQWTFTRTPNEIAFTAAANNPIDWNTLYNFWFDCSIPPSLGSVQVDQARIGPGAIAVAVNSEVPSGIPSARVVSVGSACGQCASSFYELFPNATFDLANTALSMALAGGGLYTVGPSTAAFVPPTGTVLTLGDDQSTTVALPFTLPYPGGSTTQLTVCSNGFVSPVASNPSSLTPTVSLLLTGGPRWAALWHDLNPAAGGQVVFDANASGAMVTFVNVVNFSGGTGQNTFQFQFQPNGNVDLVWQTITTGGNGYMVGWSPGGGASDPGNRDLSATLSPAFTLCSGQYTGMTLAASNRPILGGPITLTMGGIPAGAGWADLAMSTTPTTPIDLTPLGMTGCFAHLVPQWDYFYFAPAAAVPTALFVPNDPTLIGATVATQGASFAPPLTPLGVVVSNALVLTVGL